MPTNLREHNNLHNDTRRQSVAIIGTRGYPSYYGGFETAVRKLGPYLVDQGWDVSVYGRADSIKLDDPDLDPRIQSIVTRGVDSKSLSTLTYGFFATIHAAWKKPDVALIMNVANGYWLPILKLRGIPTIVNVDGIEWEREKWGRFAKTVFRLGAMMTAWFADTLIADAKEIQRRWKEEFKRDSVFIPYGGDAAAELPLEPGLKHREYVLMVARFVPENTVPEFIEAAEKIAVEHDVVIVGSSGHGGGLEARVRTLSERHERVTWLGHVSDDRRLLSLWQHAGVYFHGHSVGGTNPALVQAMAVGAPIVARDTAYNREVLGDAGQFTEPTPGAILETVFTLLDDQDLRNAASDEAIRRAGDNYSWGKVCEEYGLNLGMHSVPEGAPSS